MDSKKKRWFPWQPKRGVDRELQEIMGRIAEKPDDPRLHQRMAELYLERGQRAQAIEEFIKSAECHAHAGFFLRAIALYRRILRMQEGSTEILLRLAELYILNGLLGDALVQFKKVIDQYRRRGRRKEILGVLRRLADADPQNPEVRAKYIELLHSEGFLVQAFEELIQLHTESRDLGQTTSLEELEGRIQDLYDEIQQRVQSGELDVDLERLKLQMSSVFMELKEKPEEPKQSRLHETLELEDAFLEAMEPEEEAWASEGGKMDLHERLQEGQLYLEHGLYEEAETIFRAILDVDPRHTEALKGIEEVERHLRARVIPADAPASQARVDELEETPESQRASAEDAGSGEKPPEDSSIRFELGMAYRELGLIEESMEEFRVTARNPTFAFPSHRELSACYLKKGDLEGAVEHMKRALQCSNAPKEERLEVGYQLAQVLERRGETARALRLYEKIKDVDDSFKDVRERVKALSP